MGRVAAQRLFERLAIPACASVLLCVSGITPTASAGPVNTGWGCAATQVVAVPGTWESGPANSPDNPVGLLKKMSDDLDTRSIAVNFVPYTANMIFGASLVDSWQAGFDETNRAIATLNAQCPRSDFILVGFSQGAGIAGDVLTNIGQGTGPIPADRVTYGALFSDPLRSPGTPMPLGKEGSTSGGGILGVRSTPDFGALKGAVDSFCTEGDGICSIDQAGTLIPNLAVHLKNINLADPNSIFDGINGLLTSMHLPELQKMLGVVRGVTDQTGLTTSDIAAPTDLTLPPTLSGPVVEHIQEAAQYLGDTAQLWGVIGENGEPLVSYLYAAVPDIAQLAIRLATTLAVAPAYNEHGAKHNYYSVQPIGPSDTPAVNWVAAAINSKVSA